MPSESVFVFVVGLVIFIFLSLPGIVLVRRQASSGMPAKWTVEEIDELMERRPIFPGGFCTPAIMEWRTQYHEWEAEVSEAKKSPAWKDYQRRIQRRIHDKVARTIKDGSWGRLEPSDYAVYCRVQDEIESEKGERR